MRPGVSRTLLYLAEHLTRAGIVAAQAQSRKNSYHPEPTLPPEHRAELANYARLGYDRGHIDPNGDMPSRRSQAQSFSLDNVALHVHASNAGVWNGIEGAARELALSEGELYVISGPAFIGNNIKHIGRVLVPTHSWKML